MAASPAALTSRAAGGKVVPRGAVCPRMEVFLR